MKNMLELTSRKIIILALILALATAFMSYKYLRQLEAEDVVPMTDVVIASKDIPPDTIIKASMVEIKQIPEEFLHFDAVKKIKDVAGMVAVGKIVKGEQILRDRVIKPEKHRLSYTIPEGKRALSVGITEIIGVAGMVRPGDKVDVIASFTEKELVDRYTKTVVQNATVLAVGDKRTFKEKEKPQELTTVTLAVTPEEAETIVFSEENGIIRLTLRPSFDNKSFSGKGIRYQNIVSE